MEQDDGLICAYLLDGEGGGKHLDWPEIETWKPGDGLLWVHLDRTGAQASNWIQKESGLDPLVAETAGGRVTVSAGS